MNIERLKQAIAIIEQIPENQLNLRNWQRRYTNEYRPVAESMAESDCGTIACAAGWLCLHPDMQVHGLLPRWINGEPFYQKDFHGVNQVMLYGFNALAEFFDMDETATKLLFSSRTIDEYEKFEALSDKELWLQRARVLLNKEQV